MEVDQAKEEEPIEHFFLRSRDGSYLTDALEWRLIPIDKAHVFTREEALVAIERLMDRDKKLPRFATPAQSIAGKIEAKNEDIPIFAFLTQAGTGRT